MHILIDLLHPAHVHVFRGISEELRRRGHSVIFTARDKDVTVQLLEALGISARVLSRQRSGIIGLALELVQRTTALVRMVRSERPDLLLGIMGPSIAIAGRVCRTPSIVMYDTEIATLTNRWVYPLATAVLTPDSYEGTVRGEHISYPSYHELAYLHPDHFQADPSKLAPFGVSHDDSYTVVRFVSWEASHDIGDQGIAESDRRRLIEALTERGKVLISSESQLPTDLERFAIKGPIHHIHHLLAFADLYVGESATMASEAAVLGTPAVYVADASRGYLNDLERFGLVTTFDSSGVDEVIDLVRSDWARAVSTSDLHGQMLAERVNAATWIANWLEDEFEERRSVKS